MEVQGFCTYSFDAGKEIFIRRCTYPSVVVDVYTKIERCNLLTNSHLILLGQVTVLQQYGNMACEKQINIQIQ